MTTESDILGSKILIVDDVAVNVRLLQAILQHAGYLNITTTTDPCAVYSLHRENAFDLILLDIQMPVMDGFQVIDGLKSIKNVSYPSILVVTAQPSHRLRAMQVGAGDFVSKPFDSVEILARIRYMLQVQLAKEETRHFGERMKADAQLRSAELRRSEEMFRKLAKTSVTQQRENQQLVRLASQDILTGLSNRTHIYKSLQGILTRARIQDSSVSFLRLDIDCFKKVNDMMGHQAGDKLLREFSARLVSCLRPTDILGRLGGDEFGLIVETSAETFGAPFTAGRIRNALKTPFKIEGHDILATACIGIANFPVDATDAEELVRCAEIALYEAKASGRNTSRSYTAQMRALSLEKSALESELRSAQSRCEFTLQYQPKFQISSNQVTSVEALIRWNRPGHGLVSPLNFIPTLEETGLIVPVGGWIINTACRQIHEWRSTGIAPVRISVNVSSRQVGEERFVAQVIEALGTYHTDPALLEFEITESTFMAHGDATDATLRKLKKLGISIAIDDFGTGYSNLAYLKRFQLDALKLDIAFVRDVATDADAASIAVAIIDMADSLRLKVIAEGVETVEQLQFLHYHGCDEAQGFLLSEPLPVNELTQMLSKLAKRGAQPKRSLQAGDRIMARG